VSQEAISYDASHIQVLEGREAVRKRPGMYVGSVGERGVHQTVFEIANRAVDEVLAGRASCVDITLTSDGGVRVADDGAGVPVVNGEYTSGLGLDALLIRMNNRAKPVGRHGVMDFGAGPFVTNALSSRLVAEVRREGVRWVQEYARGIPVTPLTNMGSTAEGGTTITFWPDADIFETVRCSFDKLAERFRELAFLNQGLDISLTEQRRTAEPRSARFRYLGGARDFVAFLDEQAGPPVHPDVISFEREDPRMAGTMEVAFRWCGSHEERVQSFANSWPTPCGGAHVLGFRAGVASAANTYAREWRLLTATDPDLSADRIGEGLTAVVSVKLDGPEFEGATRGVLANTAVRACVGQATQEHFGEWLRGHPERAAAVLKQLVQGARQD